MNKLLVGVVGATGTGKSAAIFGNKELGIEGLNPTETFLINIADKPLPIKGWNKHYTEFMGEKGGNYLSTNSPELIVKAMSIVNSSRPDIKNIVLDDMQYIMAFEFMSKALRKDWDKFNEIGKHMFDVLNAARSLREGMKFFALTHPEEVQKKGGFDTSLKMKTVGKMVDQFITLEGLFLVVLYTDVVWHEKEEKADYRFITNKTNDYPGKSPYGMFDNIAIPNDLGYVVRKIDEYYA